VNDGKKTRTRLLRFSTMNVPWFPASKWLYECCQECQNRERVEAPAEETTKALSDV
jgi:hypothetical protein